MRSALAILLAAVGMAGIAAPSLAAAPAGGGTAGEPPPANLRVEKTADTVILTDGTKITGTILAAGLRAIIIIEQDQDYERVIKRSEIESFSYAATGSGEVKGYATGVRPDEGLPVIVGEGSAAAATAAGPSTSQPARGGKPSPASGADKDLGKLWELLGSNASADDLKTAVEANPQWRREVSRLMAGNVPPEGAEAVGKIKARMAREPELRKLILDWAGRQGKLPGNPQGGRKGR